MFKRLAVLLTICALGALLTAAAAVAAAPQNQARQALETAVTGILEDIKNPAYANPATRASMRGRIEADVRKIFDFDEFASRTAGANWRRFTPEQRTSFSNAFADLLLSTYLGKIDGYSGEKILYTGEVSSPSGDRVEVRTDLKLNNGKTIPVAYRMLSKQGSWRVYDVLIEGISLVKNYRTQFQDILGKGTPEQLIARVQDKAREMRDQNHAKQ
ncbi:MAG: ABC transporter substrate-binding protein [Desulfovibrionaceae bacterium]|nr:ABC transporter substrate-binding protein [Desulfovibrionaceae bacterium]